MMFRHPEGWTTYYKSGFFFRISMPRIFFLTSEVMKNKLLIWNGLTWHDGQADNYHSDNTAITGATPTDHHHTTYRC